MREQQLLRIARTLHGQRRLRVTERVRPLNPGIHIGNRHRPTMPVVIVAAEPDRRNA